MNDTDLRNIDWGAAIDQALSKWAKQDIAGNQIDLTLELLKAQDRKGKKNAKN